MLIREVMTAPVVTVPRRATVRQAIRVLHEYDITAAPVIDDDGIVELRGTAGEPARRLADVLARTVPGVTRVAILAPADHT